MCVCVTLIYVYWQSMSHCLILKADLLKSYSYSEVITHGTNSNLMHYQEMTKYYAAKYAKLNKSDQLSASLQIMKAYVIMLVKSRIVI